jgi:dCTP deaminase
VKLSDRDIRARIFSMTGEKAIGLDPRPPEDAIKGASIDLRLGYEFQRFARRPGPDADPHAPPPGIIDLWGPPEETRKAIDAALEDHLRLKEGEAITLEPGELALGATMESITVPGDLCGILNGRSSLARLGLMVHATAHFVDPGWQGCIVLEFFNCGPARLRLRPGMPICALSFDVLSSPAEHPYALRGDAKYKQQTGVLNSRISFDRQA